MDLTSVGTMNPAPTTAQTSDCAGRCGRSHHSGVRPGTYWVSGRSLLVSDYVDRDLHRRNGSAVLKPVCGVPVLGPAHSRPVVRSHSISMVSDRSLQYVDDAWSAFLVVHRAEDAPRLDGHHPHSKLAPCHALDLGARVNRCKYLRGNTFGRRCRLFVAHRALLSVVPGPTFDPQPHVAYAAAWPCRLFACRRSNTFADAVDEGPSVVVAVPAEGLHGGRAGAGPLRHGAAGRAPGGDAVGVRAPVPADRPAMPTDRRVGLRGLGPALGVVLPRLAAAVGRHVEQGQGPVDRLVATARRGVGEERSVAVAQETGDGTHAVADRRGHAPHRIPGLGVAHEFDVGGHLVPPSGGQDGERDAAGVEVDGVLHVPGRGGAALALPLVGRAVVPHVLVDHELVAALEQVQEL